MNSLLSPRYPACSIARGLHATWPGRGAHTDARLFQMGHVAVRTAPKSIKTTGILPKKGTLEGNQAQPGRGRRRLCVVGARA